MMKNILLFCFAFFLFSGLKAQQYAHNNGIKINIGTGLFVQSDYWKNSATSASTKFNGQIRLKKNLTNTDGTFQGNLGAKLIFDGTSMQYVYGNILPVLHDLEVNNLGNHLTLENGVRITNSLLLTNGKLYSEIAPIYFSSSALNPVETSANRIIGTANMETRSIGTTAFPVFLNLEIAAGSSIGAASIIRKTGTQGIISVGGNSGIACNWTMNSTIDAARNVTFSWLSDLDNGKNLLLAGRWRTATSGALTSSWVEISTPADLSLRTHSQTVNNLTNTWTYTDQASPLILLTCPTNQTVFADAGVCSYTHIGTSWNPTLGVGVTSSTYSLTGATGGSGLSTLNGVRFNVGLTNVTWTVVTATGTGSCSFQVVVQSSGSVAMTVATAQTVINSCDSTLIPVLLQGYLNMSGGYAKLRFKVGTSSSALTTSFFVSDSVSVGYFSKLVYLNGNTNYFYALEATNVCSGLLTLGNIVPFQTPIAGINNNIGSSFGVCQGNLTPPIGNALPSGVAINWQISADSLNWNDIIGQNNVQLPPFTPIDTAFYRRKITSATCEKISNVIKIFPLRRFISETDSLILVQIYNQTNGNNWNFTWNLASPVTTWYGVEICNGRVTKLSLSNNNLTGTFPSSALSFGSIPIDLSGNSLEFDSFEPFVSNSQFLYNPQDFIREELDTTVVEGENLTLRVYAQGSANRYQWLKDDNILGSETDTILIFNNIQLEDAGKYTTFVNNTIATGVTLVRRDIRVHVLPLAVKTCDSLLLVSLYQATDGTNWDKKWDLAQPVRKWYGISFNREGKISQINLASNHLKGNLPDVFADTCTSFAQNLLYLNLANNKLNDTLPPSLGVLKVLTFLDLSSNKISGKIPQQFGGLLGLKTLSLDNNHLTKIAESIGNLPNLSSFTISQNKIKTLPIELENLDSLKILDVSSNLLTTLPENIGALRNLHTFLARNNELRELPTSFASLTNLEVLAVNKNQLSNLPNLLNMHKLVFLSVSENALEFDDLLPYQHFAHQNFFYSPQAHINKEQEIFVNLGKDVDLEVITNGNGNRYQWFHNEISIDKYGKIATLNFVRKKDAGTYIAKITNLALPLLTLYRRPIFLNIDCKDLYPTAIATNDGLGICKDANTYVRFYVKNDIKNTKYFWYKNGVLENNTLANTYTATDTGTYYLVAHFKDGCSVKSNEMKVFFNNAWLIISADGGKIGYQSNVSVNNFQWYLNDEPIGASFNTNDSLYVQKIGDYQLRAIDEFGCDLVSNSIFVGVTSSQDAEKTNFLIYPNPAQNFLKVHFGKYSKGLITIKDVLGREMYQTQAEGEEISISTAHFPLGTYFLTIEIGDEKHITKFVKN